MRVLRWRFIGEELFGGVLCVVDGYDLFVCVYVLYRFWFIGCGVIVVVGVGKCFKERGGEVDFGSRCLILKDNFGYFVRCLDVDKIYYMFCLDYRVYWNFYVNEVKFFCYENIIIIKKDLLVWIRIVYFFVLRLEGL